MSDEKIVAPEEQAPEEKTEYSVQTAEEEARDQKRRRLLLTSLLLLLLLLFCLCGLFYRYWQEPEPLPEIVPLPGEAVYPPHYLYSIYSLNRPVGVVVSPDSETIYVAESAGERLIKAFDRDGNLLFSFAPPETRPGERAPVYLAIDSQGRVYVSDRLQHAIYVFDAGGNFLDTILDTDLTLGEYVAKHQGGLEPGTPFVYNIFWQDVRIGEPNTPQATTLPAPSRAAWAPLGVSFDADGNLWVTDVSKTMDSVMMMPAARFATDPPWLDFGGDDLFTFGPTGEGQGEFLFPNATARDSQGRVFISDGNNGRVQAWSAEGEYLFAFGRGTGDGALSLPRGVFIDDKDRLYVVDAVGQDVKVFDVSGEEPVFLYSFGDFGLEDGQFNYPNDIFVDSSGRLYIVDRENHRIQVWLY